MKYILENRLSKEFINSLNIINYTGEIKVIDTMIDAEIASIELSKENIVGFDTESRPSFNKGDNYGVTLIQICSPQKCYLFRIGEFGMTDELRGILENPNIKKVGIGLKDDLAKLKDFADITPAGFIDIVKIAESKGIKQPGARALTARYLNGRLSKAAQMSNWAANNLSKKQILYAATDAWICLKLYPILLKDPNIYTDEENNDNISD